MASLSKVCNLKHLTISECGKCSSMDILPQQQDERVG